MILQEMNTQQLNSFYILIGHRGGTSTVEVSTEGHGVRLGSGVGDAGVAVSTEGQGVKRGAGIGDSTVEVSTQGKGIKFLLPFDESIYQPLILKIFDLDGNVVDAATDIICGYERIINAAGTIRAVIPRSDLPIDSWFLKPPDRATELNMSYYLRIYSADGTPIFYGILTERNIGDDYITILGMSEESLLNQNITPVDYGRVYENWDIADVARHLIDGWHWLRVKDQTQWEAAEASDNIDTSTEPGVVILDKTEGEEPHYVEEGYITLKFESSSIPGFKSWERIRWSSDYEGSVSTVMQYSTDGSTWSEEMVGGLPEQLGIDPGWTNEATVYVKITLRTEDTVSENEEGIPTGRTPALFAVEVIARTTSNLGVGTIPASTDDMIRDLLADNSTALAVLSEACEQTGHEFWVEEGNLFLGTLGSDKAGEICFRKNSNTAIRALSDADSELCNIVIAHSWGNDINRLETIIRDQDSIDEYGPHIKTAEFDVDSLADLTTEATSYLNAHKEPASAFSVDVFEDAQAHLGDIVKVVDPTQEFVSTGRIIRERREYQEGAVRVHYEIEVEDLRLNELIRARRERLASPLKPLGVWARGGKGSITIGFSRPRRSDWLRTEYHLYKEDEPEPSKYLVWAERVNVAVFEDLPVADPPASGTRYYAYLINYFTDGRVSEASDWVSALVLRDIVGDGLPPATPEWIETNPLTTLYVTGKSYIRAEWEPNTEPDLKHYELEWGLSVDGGEIEDPKAIIVSKEWLHFEVPAGETIYVRVRAHDLDGLTSDWSTIEDIESAVETDSPLPVEEIVAYGGPGFVNILWKRSWNLNFSHYELERTEGYDWIAVEEVESNEHTDNDVVVGTEYWYRVRVVDIYDNKSTWKEMDTGEDGATSHDIEIGDGLPPAAPTGLSLEYVQGNIIGYPVAGVRATWDANTEEDLKHYELIWGTSMSGSPAEIDDPRSITVSRSAVMFPVPADEIIYVQVRAHDLEGYNSDWSLVDSTHEDVPDPSAPSSITVERALGINVVTWTHVDMNYFSHYQVQWRLDGAEWATPPTDCKSVQGTEFTHKVYPTDKYYYRVRTFDVFGSSSDWQTSTIVERDPPAVPTGLDLSTFYVGHRSYVKATWDANTEVDLKHYELEWGTALNEADIADPRKLVVSDTDITFDVPPDTTIYVRIRAHNIENLVSNWSAIDNITSAKLTVDPTAPASIIAYGGYNLIFITWSWSEFPEFSYYELQRIEDGEDWAASVSFIINANEYIDKAISIDTDYWYRVRVVDIYANTSDWVTISAVVSAYSVDSDLSTLDGKLTTLEGDLSDLDTKIDELDFTDIEGYLQAGQVTDDLIIARMILAGEIKTIKLDVDEIVGNSAWFDKITTNHLNVDEIVGNEAWFGKIVADHLAVDSVTAAKIKAGEITANKLTALLELEVGQRIKIGTDLEVGRGVGPSGSTFDGIYIKAGDLYTEMSASKIEIKGDFVLAEGDNKIIFEDGQMELQDAEQGAYGVDWYSIDIRSSKSINSALLATFAYLEAANAGSFTVYSVGDATHANNIGFTAQAHSSNDAGNTVVLYAEAYDASGANKKTGKIRYYYDDFWYADPGIYGAVFN